MVFRSIFFFCFLLFHSSPIRSHSYICFHNRFLNSTSLRPLFFLCQIKILIKFYSITFIHKYPNSGHLFQTHGSQEQVSHRKSLFSWNSHSGEGDRQTCHLLMLPWLLLSTMTCDHHKLGGFSKHIIWFNLVNSFKGVEQIPLTSFYRYNWTKRQSEIINSIIR